MVMVRSLIQIYFRGRKILMDMNLKPQEQKQMQVKFVSHKDVCIISPEQLEQLQNCLQLELKNILGKDGLLFLTESIAMGMLSGGMNYKLRVTSPEKIKILEYLKLQP